TWSILADTGCTCAGWAWTGWAWAIVVPETGTIRATATAAARLFTIELPVPRRPAVISQSLPVPGQADLHATLILALRFVTNRRIHGRVAPAGVRERRVGELCRSAEVVHLLQPVDRGREALVTRLELQRQVERVVPRLVQVAAVEPQAVLLRGLPHVALLALPGAGVLGGVGAQ